jgi:hypothetical protein
MEDDMLTAERTEHSPKAERALMAAIDAGPSMEERERAVAELLALAAGDRNVLEDARSQLQRRLERRGDDFAATHGLRLIEAALRRAPRPQGLWAWQDRERRRRRWPSLLGRRPRR